MIYSLVVPATFEAVTEVRILEWHGEPGRRFEAGELIVEFETHKAVVEVRAEKPAVLRSRLAEAGDWRDAGQPIAVLSDDPVEAVPETLEALAGLEPPAVLYELF